MLESEIENKLKKEIETLGGLSLKFPSLEWQECQIDWCYYQKEKYAL